MVVTKDQRREEMGNHCLMGTKIQFCKMKLVLETDSGNGCTVYEYP